MREKASAAKKNHPSTPYPLRRCCPHRCRTPCFQLAPSPHIFLLQVRSKLRSVCLLHLHFRPNFWTWLRIQLIRMKLDWNNRTVVLEHLHHLVWIQSHTHNWLQHLLRIPNHLGPTNFCPILLPNEENILLVLHQIALPDHHLQTIVFARKDMILFYVSRCQKSH